MITGKRVLAVIPASNDPKGPKDKYTRYIAGKSLIAWTIEEAEQSRFIDKLILSSDDLTIIQEATNCGCDVPFLRPKSLASDDTSPLDLILHAVEIMTGYDYVVILSPSSPLRTTEDIDNCLQLCLSLKAPTAISVTEYVNSIQRCYTLTEDFHLRSIIKDPPSKVYMQNDAIVVADIAWLQMRRSFMLDETVAYVMPQDRALSVVTDFDLHLAEVSMRYTLQETA